MVNRLYVSRKGGRGLTCIEDCVDSSIQGLEDYTKKSKKRLIASANYIYHSQIQLCVKWTYNVHIYIT